MSSNDHAHDMSLNDPVHDMSSTDPAADRAAARGRSVARRRNRVSAGIALFQGSCLFGFMICLPCLLACLYTMFDLSDCR